MVEQERPANTALAFGSRKRKNLFKDIRIPIVFI